MNGRAIVGGLLGILCAAGSASAGEWSALRLKTTDELHYDWSRGMNAVRKVARVIVTPGPDGGGRLRYVARFRDGRDDAVARREAALSPADMAGLREAVAAAGLRALDGETIGHLMETSPRFQLVLEDDAGLARVRGAGFGDHAETVGALCEVLRDLVRRGPPLSGDDPEGAPPGDLRLTLARKSALVRRGEGEDAPTYGLRKRTRYVVEGERLRVEATFSDTDGDVARSEREVALSSAERAELEERMAAARIPHRAGSETSNLLQDTPVYELAQARPGAAPAVVRGEGFGRHEDTLKPLVDLLVYLGRRGPDLGDGPEPAEPRDPEADGGLIEAIDRPLGG